MNSPHYVDLNPTNSYICLAYLYIFFKEDILKTQERETGGLKACKEKRVSQQTGPDRCSAILSTVINDELKKHFKDVLNKDKKKILLGLLVCS